MANSLIVWANLRLEFSAEGSDNKHVVVCPIYKGEDIIEGVENVGRILVNSFAKDAAYRLSQQNVTLPKTIVDRTIENLNGATV